MGAIYVVVPASEGLQWLREKKVEVPAGAEKARWPSPDELKESLSGMSGYQVTFRDNTSGGWDAEIVDETDGYMGWSATIWVKEIADSAAPHPFSFHKPRVELAIAILERLARTCGPFVLTDDQKARPVVITAGCNPLERAGALEQAS